MHANMRLVVLSLAAVVVAGCASSMEKDSAALTPAAKPGSVVVDAEYMAAVEQVARRRNIGVVWVNPPSKRVAGDPRQAMR